MQDGSRLLSFDRQLLSSALTLSHLCRNGRVAGCATLFHHRRVWLLHAHTHLRTSPQAAGECLPCRWHEGVRSDIFTAGARFASSASTTSALTGCMSSSTSKATAVARCTIFAEGRPAVWPPPAPPVPRPWPENICNTARTVSALGGAKGHHRHCIISAAAGLLAAQICTQSQQRHSRHTRAAVKIHPHPARHAPGPARVLAHRLW